MAYREVAMWEVGSPRGMGTPRSTRGLPAGWEITAASTVKPTVRRPCVLKRSGSAQLSRSRRSLPGESSRARKQASVGALAADQPEPLSGACAVNIRWRGQVAVGLP